jgi:hypothetical protein
MTKATLAMIFAAPVVLGGILLIAHASADDRPRRIEPIPVSELARRPVLGRLGHSLGGIVTIEGTVADGSFTRAKADEGETLLRVRIVNGKRLKDEQVFPFRPSPWAKVSRPKVGSKFKYIGYETGGYTGIPADAFKYIPKVATTGYGFTTSFVVLRDEKRRE